uniref:Odorant receptor n=1 Tax=Meteorus pulchricornis TaxID=51522 RepID=A0A1S5VFL2_9HYME|nr:olfactory receptor 24 [Meteorus pulchricornis]
MIWTSDTVNALGLYRMVGRIIGIWPIDHTCTLPKIKMAFVIITLMWMCIDLIKQLVAKGSCGTVTEIVDLISFFTCGWLSVMKLIALRTHEKYIFEIMNSAIKDWVKLNNRTSRSIMLQYASIGRTVFISQAIGYCCSIVFLISSHLPSITTLRDSPMNSTVTINGLPLWSECWIPVGISMPQYAIQFILQSFILAVLDICYSSCDSYFFGMAMHLCGQLEVLSMYFEDLYEIDNFEVQTCHLIQFVKRHQHLLLLTNMLEKAYNFIILIHVGVATMIICVSGIVLLMSLETSNFNVIGDMLLRIVLTYLQLFMYCYAGEQLSSQAMKLENTIYNCPWYDMPPDSVRSMSFVIMRCRYPSNLTAGKIYCMNFQNFVNIIKTTTSYFSVIRLLLKGNR